MYARYVRHNRISLSATIVTIGYTHIPQIFGRLCIFDAPGGSPILRNTTHRIWSNHLILFIEYAFFYFSYRLFGHRGDIKSYFARR